MLWRMPSLVKRDGSNVTYLRQRVPADVAAKAVGTTLRLPVGDDEAVVTIGTSGYVKASMRTHDPVEGKARLAKAQAHLAAVWKSLREGPQHLTQRRISALAGDAYQRAKARWEEEPGPASVWEVLGNAATRWNDAETLREMKPHVDEVLDRQALTADKASRERLAFAMRDMWRDAAKLMQRRANNDYGADTAPERAAMPDRVSAAGAQKISGLLNGWVKEAEATNLATSTIDGYTSVIKRFIAFVGHDDATAVTPHNVVAYKDMRLDVGRSPKTVNDGDLVALKSVFDWGKRNHRLRTNPAEGITVKVGKKSRTRSPGYNDQEAKAVLAAASAYKPTDRELAKTAAAKRWTPWLAAYTGARIGELVQLRREDVVQEADHWAIRITPEAGTVKNKRMREVPLHPHLVELGFIDYALGQKGYLFLTAKKPSEVSGRLKAIKNRVREFVAAVVSIEGVAPNHAWRHRFMTKARKSGLDQEKRRMITGHAGEGVDEQDYGDAAGLYEEIIKLPRYDGR
ncbi:MAG TPA: tyrosine-type recombinase/integrase [Pseudolabrys sp.]|nr:tyrosine-type recombinase/integrase [Pseudolabrys sp.]